MGAARASICLCRPRFTRVLRARVLRFGEAKASTSLPSFIRKLAQRPPNKCQMRVTVVPYKRAVPARQILVLHVFGFCCTTFYRVRLRPYKNINKKKKAQTPYLRPEQLEGVLAPGLAKAPQLSPIERGGAQAPLGWAIGFIDYLYKGSTARRPTAVAQAALHLAHASWAKPFFFFLLLRKKPASGPFAR